MPQPQRIKGMVALGGVTYRIVRVHAATYAVVRILDDLQVGTFRTSPVLEVTPAAIEPALLMAVARQAMQLARTSWVRQPRPTDVPSRARDGTPRARRRASSMPPPNRA